MACGHAHRSSLGTTTKALAILVVAFGGCGSDELKAPPLFTNTGSPDASDLPNFNDPNGRVVIDPFANSCATSTIRPERVPLDLIFMFDTSGSMADLTAGGVTKWNAVRAAFADFARSADSLGLGAAVHFFPMAQTGVPAECNASAQCGAYGPCEFLKGCANAGKSLPACQTDADCGAAGPCQPIGLCGVSRLYCLGLGGRCSDKAGDLCNTLAGRCALRELCDPVRYAMGASAVTALPEGAATLLGLLETKAPEGGTPTGPALQGAISRARDQAMSHPGRRVAVVLATDGFPTTCNPQSLDDIAQVATGGRMGSPSIPTFVVGVFAQDEAATAQANLSRISAAGGTPKAFVVATSGNVSGDFLAALNDIRATALACEYRIPDAQRGALDYAQINLRFVSSTAAASTVGNVASASACSATKGGWYYDVLPTQGTPTSVKVCPATCDRFRADPRGRVDLIVGCKTVQVD